ncbi:uncharacterized protein LODBEIA_P28390 [Lodderomyces beijingensis]|uniref:Uncharacterized protein n=1 Tax=Lodderomyces beijingensis TaxID=1775926 RepID=A0ABP0ZN24_9ASCO
MSSIPENPRDTSFFKPQHGYNDIQYKTEKYSDKPTPIVMPKQNKATEFLSDHTDKEHMKGYAKSGGKRLFNTLIGFVCH